ncbi:MAG: cupin domain-containing protein [Maricaulaceae bacterium]
MKQSIRHQLLNRPYVSGLAVIIVSLSLTSCVGGNVSNVDQPVECANISINTNLEVSEIDPTIYFAENGAEDPFKGVYSEFRKKRALDMENLSGPEAAASRSPVHVSSEIPWSNLTDIIKLAAHEGSLAPTEKVQQLGGAVKMRLALDHPDIKIVQLMIGPGGVLPAHAGGAPGIYIVIEGKGNIAIEQQSWAVTPGTTAKVEPYDVRRLSASKDGPLKVIWIRWAPGGDQKYRSAGYYLTGANQHVQPKSANMPEDYQFYGQDHSPSNSSAVNSEWMSPIEGSPLEAMADGLAIAREKVTNERNLYSAVSTVSHEGEISWLNKEKLETANFFWAKDIKQLGELLTRWSEVFRYKGIFQASRPDGGWDFNISQMAWGPHARYVEHSHSIPEFYYMLSGPVEHWIGDNKFVAMPGDIFVTDSFEPHQSRGIKDDLIFRNISASWAPNGDRAVFERPFYLVGEVPDQVSSADLGINPSFH